MGEKLSEVGSAEMKGGGQRKAEAVEERRLFRGIVGRNRCKISDDVPGRKVGGPARAQGPRLERRFGFEEGSVTSLPVAALPNVSAPPRGRPVKPARKNLPKVALPALPGPSGSSEGIDSIFGGPAVVPPSSTGDATLPNPLRCFGGRGNSASPAPGAPGGGLAKSKAAKQSNDAPAVAGRPSESASRDATPLCSAANPIEVPRSFLRPFLGGTGDAIGGPAELPGRPRAGGSDVGGGEEVGSVGRPDEAVLASGRLTSQDSGVEVFPRERSLESGRRWRPSSYKERFLGEFGDVSDDIGIERLACQRPQGPGDPVGVGDPCSYVLNNGGNFNLSGEFGDVSEDLGAGRFPSLPVEVVGNVGNPAAPAILDFPGVSADSGLEEEEAIEMEDGYLYDEDYNQGHSGDLDEELILEVLCANRVNQMTRTYNDIEAVSRLLEEKEKDLELTARIGKELLEQNQSLKVRLAALEVEIRSTNDENTQLRHELQQKTQLLHALTSDEDGSPLDPWTSPLVSPSSGVAPMLPSGPIGAPLGVLGGRARAGVELLKRRIAWLEGENRSLRTEASQLAKDTQRVEEEEAKLVEGVTQQLASVSKESRLLSEELERLRGEGGRQREEADVLATKLEGAVQEVQRLRSENEELSSLVLITRENQDRLTTELADFKERYGEVMCLLTEAQENLRKVRQKELPCALAGSRYLTPPITTHHSLQGHYGDSIALELESSLNYGLSLDSGIHMPQDVSPKVPHYHKVFETVRSASRSSGSPSPSPLHHQQQSGSSSSFAQLSTHTSTLSSASGMQACRMSTRASDGTAVGDYGRGLHHQRHTFGEPPRHPSAALPSTGFHSLDSTGQSEESDQSEFATDSEDSLYPGVMRDGIPGSPGAKELEAALARIAKQQQLAQPPPLTKGEKAIGGYEGRSREPSLDGSGRERWSMTSSMSVSSSTTLHQQLPYGCRTPDSIMSTGSSRGSSRSWRMPEKLQIVKPLEGSLTLGWWTRLATPSLSAALEERPGVKVRGGESGAVQQHTLLDLEEDDETSSSSSTLPSVASTKAGTKEPFHPGKFFQGTNSVYTLTNSTVLHPDNTVPPSPAPLSPPSSPTPLRSRRSSVSMATPTFSTALGLAKMLRERGVSPSTTPVQDDYTSAHFTSATATPCNSPDDTPLSTRSPSPDEFADEDDASNPIVSLISSGAELLRRSLAGSLAPIPQRVLLGERSSRRRSCSGKVMAGMKLVEKLEQIGVEQMVCGPQGPKLFRGLVPLSTTLQVGGAMYARPAIKSPMAQLTSLKSMMVRTRSSEAQAEEDAARGGGRLGPSTGPSPAKQLRGKFPRRRREDLGTVPPTAKNPGPKKEGPKDEGRPLGPTSTRGTISAIFFGRKGGLM